MKKPEELRLLIHHHHTAYLGKNNTIWLTSVIGRWVEALADYLGEVGLLLYQSNSHLLQLDTPISKPNVKLHSLGPRRMVKKRVFKRNNLHQACLVASENADGLLIRGITPHQYAVWRNTPTAHKAFLLVGSLEQEKQNSLNSMEGVITQFLRYIRLNEFRRIVSSQTLIMANSSVVVDQVERKYGKEARFVPTNSIRRSEFAPYQARPVEIPWKLLYCGRLDLKKGLRELINAVAVLNQGGKPCLLDILGATLEPAYSELIELSSNLGVQKFIHWHGMVSYGPDLFAYYQHADAFVLPSYTEGFPHAIWEAAANCCPVIATAVGGIPGLLEHEKHALLIPPKDVEEVISAVKRILTDDPLRQRLIKNAYQHAIGFSVEACAEKLATTLSEAWNYYE